jgi:predicted flap endonuclease-1-like 5' DNA nuclease
MLWLVWHMWILIGLAFAGGVIAGWVIRSRSDETPQRPMLEKLDATVVAPVETPGAEAAPEATAAAAVEPSVAVTTPEPAAAPATDPKSTAKKPAPKAKPLAKAKAAADPAGASEAGAGDDLTRIKGLGPKAAEKLKAEGVQRLSDIASWSDADVERFDALINGRGRISRDAWVKQARDLAG